MCAIWLKKKCQNLSFVRRLPPITQVTVQRNCTTSLSLLWQRGAIQPNPFLGFAFHKFEDVQVNKISSEMKVSLPHKTFQLLEYQWSEGKQTSSDPTRRFQQFYDWGNLNDIRHKRVRWDRSCPFCRASKKIYPFGFSREQIHILGPLWYSKVQYILAVFPCPLRHLSIYFLC